MNADTVDPAGGSPPAGVRTIPAPSVGATRIVLVRHGEANCNVEGIVGGQTGCTGLSAAGVAEAEALQRRLVASGELAGVTAVYASVLPRALETAAIVAPGLGGRVAVADCDLCELHPGEADGLTWSEFTDRYGGPNWDVEPDNELAPGAESWTGFTKRVSGALTAIAERHPGELVVVFCHGGVVEASIESLLPVTTSRGRLKLRTAHTSLTEWELGPGGWLLLRYNDAAHLPTRREPDQQA
ncbi:MAG TPA: histidine phosphatase family protein [Acidimicrobiales bacterium]|nr:histidine phosphatase family protein [Acidimicrobiales bacterium]